MKALRPEVPDQRTSADWSAGATTFSYNPRADWTTRTLATGPASSYGYEQASRLNFFSGVRIVSAIQVRGGDPHAVPKVPAQPSWLAASKACAVLPSCVGLSAAS